MIALDTNLLARLLLKDDAKQYARVKALLQSNQTFTAPVTVLLELVWVLEANDCTPAEIASGMTLLLGLPNFRPAQADAMADALQAYSQGMDFADALYLALCRGDESLMTFDRAFVRKATKLGRSPRVVAA